MRLNRLDIENIKKGIVITARKYNKEEYLELIHDTVVSTYEKEHYSTIFSNEAVILSKMILLLRQNETNELKLTFSRKESLELNSKYILSEFEKWVNTLLNETYMGRFQKISIEYKEEMADSLTLPYCEPYTNEELKKIIEIEEKAEVDRGKYRSIHTLKRKPNKDNIYPGKILTNWYQIFEDVGMFTAKKVRENEDDGNNLKIEYDFLYDCMVLIKEFPESIAYDRQKYEKVRDCILAYNKYKDRK